MRCKISFTTLQEAYEFANFGGPGEHEAYLNTETGEIFYHSELGDDEEPLPGDIDDSGKYIALPHKGELNLGKDLALRFAADTLPDHLGEVQGMFSRPGAYSRFKDLLEHYGLLQPWYEYEAVAQREALRRWCQERQIEIGLDDRL